MAEPSTPVHRPRLRRLARGVSALMLDPFYLIVDDAGWLAAPAAAGRQARAIARQGSRRGGAARADRAARAICARRHGAQLVVNDYWRLAIERRLRLRPSRPGRSRRGRHRRRSAAHGVRLGVSARMTTPSSSARLSLAPDYVALGPIYPTLLKQMAFAPQGLDKLGVWKKRIGDDSAGRHRRADAERARRRARRRRRQRLRRHRHSARARPADAHDRNGLPQRRPGARRRS